MKKQRRYILNMHTGVLHRFPAMESCNVDAIPQRSRLYFNQRGYRKAKMAPFFDRLCRRCF
jgi:hypothetical protein